MMMRKFLERKNNTTTKSARTVKCVHIWYTILYEFLSGALLSLTEDKQASRNAENILGSTSNIAMDSIYSVTAVNTRACNVLVHYASQNSIAFLFMIRLNQHNNN